MGARACRLRLGVGLSTSVAYKSAGYVEYHPVLRHPLFRSSSALLVRIFSKPTRSTWTKEKLGAT